MQNATKLYRILKAVQGFILIALGIVISVFYNNADTQIAIGYCVATVLLIFGILTISISYIFQRGIASSDMISGVLISAVSIFVYLSPDLVIKFIPIVASAAALIYAVVLIIEATICFVHKVNLRGSIYVIVSALLLALGISCIVLSQNPKMGKIVVLMIGIFLILAGLIFSILSLIQPKQEVIISGSKLVTDANLPANVKKDEEKSSSKKASKEPVKQIESKETKKSKSKKKAENNEVIDEKPELLDNKSDKIEHKKDNKKAADKHDSDVIELGEIKED